MPRSQPGARDRHGFAWDGDVLNGKLSAAEAFALEQRRAIARQRAPAKPVPPKHYDPVLKHHLGIKDD